MKLATILLISLLSCILCQKACSNIPADNVYYLTSFCDKQTACGKSCGNCTWYYAADSQRFKCGSKISCARSTHNVNLEVIDYGPDCELERKSGKPIIDASYSTCKLFTGSNSCGWSDKFSVICKKISAPGRGEGIPLGECTWDSSNTKLPFCHREENRGKVTFEAIEEWLEQDERAMITEQ